MNSQSIALPEISLSNYRYSDIQYQWQSYHSYVKTCKSFILIISNFVTNNVHYWPVFVVTSREPAMTSHVAMTSHRVVQCCRQYIGVYHCACCSVCLYVPVRLSVRLLQSESFLCGWTLRSKLGSSSIDDLSTTRKVADIFPPSQKQPFSPHTLLARMLLRSDKMQRIGLWFDLACALGLHRPHHLWKNAMIYPIFSQHFCVLKNTVVIYKWRRSKG